VLKDRARFNLAASVALLVALVLGIAAFSMLLPIADAPVGSQATPEHLSEFSLVDSRPQTRAHLVLVLLTIGVCATFFFSSRTRIAFRASSLKLNVSPNLRNAAAGATGACVLLLLARPHPYPRATFVAGMLLCGCVTAYASIHRRAPRLASLTAVATFAIYVGVMFVPGLIGTPDLSESDQLLDSAQMHYSIIVSQGDRLSRGLRLFEHVSPHYGLLAPLVLGLLQRGQSVWSFAQHIRLVQWTQVAFVIAAFAAYWCFARRRGAWVSAAICAVPTVGIASTAHVGILHPNQTGWRSLGFPIGMLVLLLVRKRGAGAATILGCTAGLLLVLNTETGVVVAATFAVYLLFGLAQGRCTSKRLLTLFQYALTGALPLLLVLAWFRWQYAHLPEPDDIHGGYSLTRFSAGYGGLRLSLNIAWIVILVHSLLELVGACLRVERLDERQRFRAAVAAAIVLWFGYFFNRPHPWNLWTFIFLYGFLVVEVFEPRVWWLRLRRAIVGKYSFALCAVAVMVAGQDVNVVESLERGQRMMKPDQAAKVLSGVRVEHLRAEQIEQQVEFLRELSGRGSIYYFTFHSYLIPLLTGIYPALPVADAFPETFTHNDFIRLSRWVHVHPVQWILFDDFTAITPPTPYRGQFFERLKGSLTDAYELDHRSSGWEVWRRRSNVTARAM
jgi:hypothetical protein